MSNTGFVDVVTQRAGRGSVSVPDLGTFAPLAGPTVGPDGTVFLGTLEGRVIALHADGGAHWNYQLPNEKIRSSPVVGSDGSVYVVVDAGVIRDHRNGETGPTARARLYKFSPVGGSPIGVTDFPKHDRGPSTLGPPNVWQYGSDEAIMVPALYPAVGGHDLHLLAFSPSGGIMDDWSVYLNSGDVTEGTDWGPRFRPGMLVPPAPMPLNVVGIAPRPRGGTPVVMLVDRFHGSIIGFRFCVGASCSPAPGFHEGLRTNHAPRLLWSSPMILPDPDLHTIVGTDDGVVFSGPNVTPRSPVTGVGPIFSTPTLAANGSVLLVNWDEDVITLRDRAIVSRVSVAGGTFGGTMARAAMSRSHVFVSTSDALYTLDANAAAIVSKFPWVGGGLWSPAIGPEGHVYAMASNVLFVFPPPRTHRDPHGPV